MKIVILLVVIISLICLGAGLAIAAEDVLVWQGQYFTGTTFNVGTYEFNFTVYDALTGGNICYSNTTTLTTGSFGEWKTEQNGVNSACHNVSKDYYLNINIDGTDQTPRRRLVVWNSLRKNVDENSIGSIEFDTVKVRLGLKDLNQAIWQSKLDYAAESANTTLVSQQDLALKIIDITHEVSNATAGESLELKIIRLQQAGEQAKAIIESDTDIAVAKILEAKRLALLNGVTSEDMAAIEEEARLNVIALNLTAQEQIVIIQSAVNNSIAEIINSDDGIRFCFSDGTNCLNNQTNSNLAPYALKNQSETFAGNITAAQTGFFGWLGSLTSRITALFVQDIDASGNIKASNYTLNGTTIKDWHDLSLGTELDPIFAAENVSIWNAILNISLTPGPKGDQGDSGVNGTNGIDGINGTNGLDGINGTNGINGVDGINGTDGTNGSDGYTPVYGVDYINGTKGDKGDPGVNGTNGIDGINGTNGIDGRNGTDGINGTSVNYTYTDTLYYSITNPNGYYNATTLPTATSNNLTNYALKNQSETFAGNITTTEYGFFGWLGSLTSRITKLFVQDIDASGNIETSQNVSAQYFKGDGSLLTNLPAGGAESDPKWTANSSTVARTGSCPAGQVVQNTTTSGVQCLTPSAGAESDPYWSANFTNLQTDCSSGDYAYGVNNDGTLKCRSDQTGSGSGLTPVYVGSNLNATSAGYTTIFTIALTPSKINLVQAYLVQSSSTNGVAVHNRVIINESGPIGNCHFVTQTQAAAEVVDNLAVSTNSADTGTTAMGLGTNVPFINKVTCTILADANSNNLIIQFDSENANTVTTYAGSYYLNAVN